MILYFVHRASSVQAARFANTMLAFVYTIERAAVLIMSARFQNAAV
jgi:hypothetical protein